MFYAYIISFACAYSPLRYRYYYHSHFTPEEIAFGEVKQFTQDLTASKWQSQNLNLSNLVAGPTLLTTGLNYLSLLICPRFPDPDAQIHTIL